MVLKKSTLYVLFLHVLFLPVLYYFINYDSAQNPDYDVYKQNYEELWGRFELGYSALESISRFFSLNFETFWLCLIFLELILIALLYTNPYVFLLALPNLLFLSQGLLGTQIRFGLAALICLVLFKNFFLNKSFYVYSVFAGLFHNGTLVFHFLSFFLKIKIDHTKRVIYRKNIIWLFVFLFFLLFLAMLINNILVILGYFYYADPSSKHMVTRSLSSLLYTGILLFFVFLLLNSRGAAVVFAPMVYLGGMMLVLSLVFYSFSIISGRYNLVFMLIEPFILYSFYKAIGSKSAIGFFSFVFLFIITCSKLFALNLVF